MADIPILGQKSDDDWDGISPEDMPVGTYSKEELRAIADSIVAPPTDENEPAIELHDSEVMKALQILVYLQEKYGRRAGTYDNLSSMAKEAEDKFEKIGLQVIVDWVGPGFAVTPEPPVITIVRRLTEFDPERQQFEVQRGVADEYWDRKRKQKGK